MVLGATQRLRAISERLLSEALPPLPPPAPEPAASPSATALDAGAADAAVNNLGNIP
jgi:hypothetical protein